MPRYKPVDRSPRLLPVVLSEQIQSGTFEFALDHLVDHELNLDALDVRFNNDEVGASAYDPRVMLKIVLLAYSRGLISSRRIEHACLHHVQFIAISGDSQPSYTHIAKFVRELGPQIKALFTEVLLTCDRMGLIGRQMFAIDGVKLPANASKERSGTGAKQSCVPCQHRDRCLRNPQSTPVRHVSLFAKNQPSAHAAIELMKQAIDSARGRHLYSQRIGTVEPVFGNIRHNKRLNRVTLRGKAKVNAQWSLYCLVHNIEKLANHRHAQ